MKNTEIKNDVKTLQELAKRVSELANLPIMEERKKEWIRHNTLKRGRPMVMVDQLPISELMEFSDELNITTTLPLFQQLEFDMKYKLFQQKYFPVDMVVDDYLEIPFPVYGLGYNLKPEIITNEDFIDIKGQTFNSVLNTYEDIEKIKAQEITVDTKTYNENMELCGNIFSGIIDVKPKLISPSYQLWDFLVQFRGVTESIMDLIDNPDFIHSALKALSDASLDTLDQLVEKKLLKTHNEIIHCTGGYTDWKDDGKICAWTFGMSQIFSTVSPAMHEEFEFPYLEPIFKRFENVYYGCCEPLHTKIGMIEKYPNVKKISMSPWANKEIGAEAISGRYVFSSKPNPAYLAAPTFEKEAVKKDLQETVDICNKYNTNCEIILKDLSTLTHDFSRVTDWVAIAESIVK